MDCRVPINVEIQRTEQLFPDVALISSSYTGKKYYKKIGKIFAGVWTVAHPQIIRAKNCVAMATAPRFFPKKLKTYT